MTVHWIALGLMIVALLILFGVLEPMSPRLVSATVLWAWAVALTAHGRIEDQ